MLLFQSKRQKIKKRYFNFYHKFKAMVKSILNQILSPITTKLTSYIQDKILFKDYTINMYNLLESQYESRLKVKNYLHTSQPIPFTDIYFPLSIKRLNSHEYDDSYPEIKITSINDLVNQATTIAIFGNAGSGKSTLVNFLYLKACEEIYKYPVIVSLRHLNVTSDSLIDYLKKQVLGLTEIDCSDKFFTALLEEGCFMFFFDGYDEIIQEKQYSITLQIKELTTKYSKNTYVLTSRLQENLYTLENFHNYIISPLNAQDRNELIRKQFTEENQNVAETIITKISQDISGIYDQLLSTPLLIVLCILNFESYSDLPNRRSDFYSRIFDALYQGHDWRSKCGYERKRKCSLLKEEYISILSMLAFRSHLKSEFLFTKENLISKFRTIKDNSYENSNIHKVRESYLFEDLCVGINILVADGIFYSFPHKSFQEYYASLYITKKNESKREQIYKVLVKKFFSESMPFLTSPLIEMMYEQDKTLFVKHFIIPFLCKIEEYIKNQIEPWNLSGQKLQYMLSIINNLFYGKDDKFYQRSFLSNEKIGNSLEEIMNLRIYANSKECLNEDDDIFLKEFLM